MKIIFLSEPNSTKQCSYTVANNNNDFKIKFILKISKKGNPLVFNFYKHKLFKTFKVNKQYELFTDLKFELTMYDKVSIYPLY